MEPRRTLIAQILSTLRFPRRPLLRLTQTLIVLWLCSTSMLYALQTDLIFPGAKRQGKPDTEVRPRADEQIVTLSTARGDRVAALFAPALTADGQPLRNADRRPTLIYFYGNGMSLSDSVDVVEHFRCLGANVLAPDYVGYGMSGGKPSEAGCQATADAVLAHLRQRKDIDSSKIVAIGWSLGGAVAIDLASRENLAGVIALSTFTSMTEMARRTMPLLPTSILLRHRFDSLSKIPRVRCPMLIGHGRRDNLVPYQMAERLADAARVPVMKFTVENASHNDFFSTGGDQVLQAVAHFIEDVARSAPPAPASAPSN